ncbi:MAG: GNAT family N-acetyltransferase [Micrococcales bacterium]|nr:GNAT family N-acetyltransferase [Micrococcales bacterium]
MPQAHLTTGRLVLEPLAEHHLDHEIELDSDGEVLRYLFAGPRTPEQTTERHRGRLALARDGLGMWAGFLREAPETFVGLFMLMPAHGSGIPADPEGQADLGYRIMRRLWRQGYASEGSRELLRHGFEDLGLRRIYAQTMAVNAGSRATMASVGLTFARAFHEDFDEPIPGAEEGEVEYGITRAQWLAARSSGGEAQPGR